jgi:hypothetical protein
MRCAFLCLTNNYLTSRKSTYQILCIQQFHRRSTGSLRSTYSRIQSWTKKITFQPLHYGISKASNTGSVLSSLELSGSSSCIKRTETFRSSQKLIKSVASNHSYSSASYKKSLSKSKEIVRKFTTPSYDAIDILSLHNGKLLVGSHENPELSVHSVYGAGDLMKSFHISTRVRDATWTAQGNILVSAEDRIQEYAFPSGELLGEKRFPCPGRFARTPSLSKSLCLADNEVGVHRSANNSILDFKFAFRSRNGGRCCEVIKTASDLYWVVKNCNNDEKMRIRKYRTVLDDRKLDIVNIDTRQKDYLPFCRRGALS